MPEVRSNNWQTQAGREIWPTCCITQVRVNQTARASISTWEINKRGKYKASEYPLTLLALSQYRPLIHCCERKVPPRDPAELWEMRGEGRKTERRCTGVSPAKGGVSGQVPDHRQTRPSDRSIPPAASSQLSLQINTMAPLSNNSVL